MAAQQTELEELDKLVSEAEGRARLDENRVKLLKQEVDMLKRHLVRSNCSSSEGNSADIVCRPQESYTTEEAVNQAGNFDEQKTARLAELETLLEAHKEEVSKLSKEVGHWRGLVEQNGRSTDEIVDLDEREGRKRVAGEDDTGVIVKSSLQEQLRLNEELQEGGLSLLVRALCLADSAPQNSTSFAMPTSSWKRISTLSSSKSLVLRRTTASAEPTIPRRPKCSNSAKARTASSMPSAPAPSNDYATKIVP